MHKWLSCDKMLALLGFLVLLYAKSIYCFNVDTEKAIVFERQNNANTGLRSLFGHSVAITKTTVVIGAPRQDAATPQGIQGTLFDCPYNPTSDKRKIKKCNKESGKIFLLNDQKVRIVFMWCDVLLHHKINVSRYAPLS